MYQFLMVGVLYAQDNSKIQKTNNTVVNNHLNFRMGYSTATTNGRPTLCLEGKVSPKGAIEACGTGYGFVHRDLGTDFVHFRAKWGVFERHFSSSQLQGQMGAGFAEIQLGADELGFQFGGTGEGIETAGPEVSASVQFIQSFGKQTELVVDVNGGTAYFHHGPDLVVPQNRVYPFVEVSAGLGW